MFVWASSSQFTQVAVAAKDKQAIVTNITGAIGVGTAHHVSAVISDAQKKNVGLIIFRLDTPGGLVAATREIIKDMLASPIPIAVYVAPGGARAASAGTYIAYAAHVSAMAPGTHMGAATPIPIGAPGLPTTPQPKQPDPATGTPRDGGPDAAGRRKIVNDAVAYLKSLAQLRGRNADWAEKAVRDAATLTATEALDLKVIDAVATNLSDLLRQIHGRSIRTAQGDIILNTDGVTIATIKSSWKSEFLSAIADPNVAFILLMIGIYGIIFEFWSPGLTGPGIVGSVSLLVAFAGLAMLPLSYAGLALLLLGIGLMVSEGFVPGFGILGLGGLVAFSLGAIFLFDPSGSDINLSVSWPIVLSAAGTSALIFIGVLGWIMRIRHRPAVTGSEQLIGSAGHVVEWAGRKGRIRIHGEIWSATSASGLAKDSVVRVVSRQGLTLQVEPA